MTGALRRGMREGHARSPEAYRRELDAARRRPGEHVPVLPRYS
jgi:hypothetical protein